jgi:hypothetical protein
MMLFTPIQLLIMRLRLEPPRWSIRLPLKTARTSTTLPDSEGPPLTKHNAMSTNSAA